MIRDNSNNRFPPAENKKPIAAKKLPRQQQTAAVPTPQQTSPMPGWQETSPIPGVRPAAPIPERQEPAAVPNSRQTAPEPERVTPIPEAQPTPPVEEPAPPAVPRTERLIPQKQQPVEEPLAGEMTGLPDDQDRPGAPDEPSAVTNDRPARPATEVRAEGPNIPDAAPMPAIDLEPRPEIEPPPQVVVPEPNVQMIELKPELVEEPAPEAEAENDKPEDPENSLGYLEIQTSTADGAIPVPDAKVTVSRREADGTDTLIGYGLTNRNGRGDIFEVPAPSENYSQHPSDDKPFAQYDVKVEKDGFYTIIIENVQAFGGTTSLQQVQMLPLPQYAESAEIVYDVLPQEL